MYYARKILLRPIGGKTPTGGLPEPAPAPVQAEQAGVSAGLVVVVYDSPTVRKMLAMHLQRHAFEVYTFTHGIEMMRWLTLSRRVPYLFLFDVRLPKINGYDLTRRIRKHPYSAASRVGLFTEEAERFDTLRGQLAGAGTWDCIKAPFLQSIVYSMIMTMKSNLPFPKGILFDMDGVLLLTTQHSEQSWQFVCQKFAPTLGLLWQDLFEVFCKMHDAYENDLEHDAQKQRRDRLKPFETRKEILNQTLEHFDKGNSQIASEMVRAYETLRCAHRQLAPCAVNVLQKFREHNLPLALLTNGNATYQRQKIQQYHLAPFFDTILIEEEFGVAKPDKRIFLAALDHLNLAAHDTWMVDDDLAFDIAGSQQLGIFAIWCNFTKNEILKENAFRPDRTIYALSELFELYRTVINM